MAKGKLGRLIWRKIGGRVIPIRIKNVADTIANASHQSKTVTWRQIKALTPEGQQIAKMTLEVPKKGKSATVVSVNVEKQFQKKGISKQLFARATQFLDRAGFKFIRSYEIQHVAQAKIRRAHGMYKAGSKSKNRTKFFADQFGPYGEETRRVTAKDVVEILKQNKSPRSTGRLVTATTMIKKKKK